MEMTQGWIDNFHRKTINFLGGFELIEDFEGKERYIETATGNTWLLEEMDFYNDWNWIMEVVNKIECLENIYFQIEEKSCYVYDISKFTNERMDSFIQQDGKTKKEAVIQAIDQFIDWYNKQK